MATKYRKKEYNTFEIIEQNGVLPFPIEIFPDDIQYILNTLKTDASFETQVTGSTLMFVVSTIIGLSRKIVIKSGVWEDTPNLWISIVGRRGTMKTPASKYILKPLENAEKEFAAEFDRNISNWAATPKKDRKDEDKPKRRQRFSNDTTVEGLIDAMAYNANGLGIYKDELNGFFEEMNRYNTGGNLEFYLSAFNGGIYIKNRKSYDTQTVNDIYLAMLGSIQPEVLRDVSTTQTSNGMIDRWLYTISDDIIPSTNMNEIQPELTNSYSMFIESMIQRCSINKSLIWKNDARDLFINSLNEIEDIMRDDCDKMLFTYLSKIKTYFARFVTIVSVMDNTDIISDEQVHKAKLLVAYYISTAMHTFIGFDNHITIDQMYKTEKAETMKAKVLAIRKHFKDKTVSDIAKMVGCTRIYASRVVNE